MDLDVVALQPGTKHQRAFRAFVHPCPNHTNTPPVYGFGIIALRPTPGRSIPPSSIGRIASTLERAVMTTPYTNDAAAWLTSCATSIRSLVEERSATEQYGICIGAVCHNGPHMNVAFTTCGGITASLIRSSGPSGAFATPIAVPSPIKSTPPFSHILEGSLTAGDVLVIGPRGLEHVIPEPLFIQSLAQLERTNGIPYLQHAIQSADEPVGAILVLHRRKLPYRPQASMAAFLATAASTERFLTPSLTPLVRDWWSHVIAMFGLLRVQRHHAREKPKRQILSFIVTAIHLVFSSLTIAAKSVTAMTADGLRILYRSARRVSRIIRRAYDRRQSANNSREQGGSLTDTSRIRAQWKFTILPSLHGAAATLRTLLTRIRSSQSWYAELPRMSQRLLILTIIFGVLFLGSTTALWRRRNMEIDVGTYNTTMAHIDELRSVAEAKLLFNDTIAARTALTEALDISRTLPRSTRPRRERAETLEKEIIATLDRARLLTHIEEPLRIARAGEQIPFSVITDIVPVGKRIVAVSGDGTQYAVVNTKTGEAVAHDLGTTNAKGLRALALDDRSFLLIDDRLQTRVIDIDTTTSTAVTIPVAPADVIAVTTASGRLYILFRDGHVTKHERTAGGFASGTTVITKAQSPTDAKTITIAGSLILGTAEGTVLAFPTSRRQPVTLTTDVDPPIHTAPVLTAVRGNTTVYIGDPIEGRVIAVATDGTLIGQTQSNAFRGLSHIAIDPSGSAIYVLHNNTISVIVPPKSRGN